MSTRPASPPSVARWPFYLGDLLLLAIALLALMTGGTPPGLGSIIVATLCVVIGIGLLVAPYLMDFEARMRVAEAAVRENLDAQMRRLAQTAEQLAHAVSRSQSTEEQAGQALGSLEELSEKLATQADELAQALVRSNADSESNLKAEVERLLRERDQMFTSLVAKIATIATSLQNAHAAAEHAAGAQTKAMADVQLRLDALGERVDEIAKTVDNLARRPAASAVAPAPASPTATPPPAPPPPEKAPDEEKPHSRRSHDGDGTNRSGHHAAREKPAEPVTSSPETTSKEPAAKETAVEEPAAPAESAEKARPRAQEPARPAVVATPTKRGRLVEDGPELALEGMPPPRPPMKMPRRDAVGVTSLVATAYIGIGNKLHLRGEGPGLSWDKGVPMQFLAIGKWGWTTTDAAGPITCRILRNDETPMLEADVVIAPGEKAEITPRF